MKRIVCLCVILLCSISFAFAQGGRGRTIKKKTVMKKIDPQLAEAEKAWIPFWKSFTLVAKNRDKKSLEELMSSDFGNRFEDKDAFLSRSELWGVIVWILNKGNQLSKISKDETINRSIMPGKADAGVILRFTFNISEKKWFFTGLDGFGA